METTKIKIRRSEERGRNRFEWLDSAHSFSFGGYYDPSNMGFLSLRVINEDWIKGGGGFPPHPHQDMEILTYPVKGALQHKDSTGSEGTIESGDIQLMSAGHGIVHSEFNASDSENVHLLQIWIQPNQRGLPPRYQQQSVTESLKSGLWTRILKSEKGEVSIAEALTEAGARTDPSLALEPRQEVEVWAKRAKAGEALEWKTQTENTYWLQLISGELRVEGKDLKAGDAIALEDAISVNLASKSESEFILFVF